MRSRLVHFAFLWIGLSLGHATVRLPAIFSDHMVLQRGRETPLWGQARPHEEVSIVWPDGHAQTVATSEGRWQTKLDLSGAPTVPFQLTIQGDNEIVISDVVVGEVWLASGQSNMEWLLQNTIAAEKEIGASANPSLRQFLVQKASVMEPVEDGAGQWTVAGPATAGKFTAVGYYFGQILQRELQAPVGIINSSWGGSPAEAWISQASLTDDPELKTAVEAKWKRVRDYPAQKAAYAAELQKWLEAHDRVDRGTEREGEYLAEGATAVSWTKLKLPGPVKADGLPFLGAIWLRKEVSVEEKAQPNEAFLVELGDITGFERVYWNGQKLLETTSANYPGTGYWRRISVPPAMIKEGTNVLCIRICAPAKPANFSIPAANFKAGRQSMAGEWKAAVEFVWPDLTPEEKSALPVPPAAPPRERDVAASLFNGMIHPFVPYGIRGVIWYQGEANANRAQQYQKTFPLLIKDWRRQWQREDLPFYFCQLANFGAKKAEPGDSAWAELREAQTKALALPKTGQAVLVDLGDAEDIHPRNKLQVGRRLAALALKNEYGRPGMADGPILSSAQVAGNKMRLFFRNVGTGLIANPVPPQYLLSSARDEKAWLIRNSPKSELEGFAVCGADQKWVWADANIEGDTVVVSSSRIPDPVAVRYAWADNPNANLYNKEGFPASPFRTDTFPGLTVSRSY